MSTLAEVVAAAVRGSAQSAVEHYRDDNIKHSPTSDENMVMNRLPHLTHPKDSSLLTRADFERLSPLLGQGPVAISPAHEAAAVAWAKERGLTEDQMTVHWHAQWHSSRELRNEFVEAGDCSAFMNAVAAGRIKFLRGSVR